MDLGGLYAAPVQKQRGESYGDVEDFARDFVFVDEDAPFAVDGDQTQG